MVVKVAGMRIVPISYETYHALMINLPFVWSKDWLARLISENCKQAGVKAGALVFRHTFGSLWSGDEIILQQIMGHTTLTTTKRYRHLRTQVLVKQHNEFTPLKMVLGSSKSML
jgi:integrase